MKLYILTASILLAGAAVSKQCKDIPCRDFPNCPPEPLPTIAPTPIPTPRPTPTPTPGVVGNPIPQGREWSVVGERFPSPDRPEPVFGELVDSVITIITGCDIGTDCPTGMGRTDFIEKVAIGVRTRGFDAGQQEPGNDELFVANLGEGGKLGQGYHVYNDGGSKAVWYAGLSGAPADWRTGKGSYRDTWRAALTDPATPPPTTACPPLTNLKIATHSNNPGSMIVDVTPRGPDCARAASIGKLCDNGVAPLGPEGTPELDAIRIACERSDVNSPYIFTWNGRPCDADGVPCFHQSDNPLSVKVTANGLVAVSAHNGVGNQVNVVVP